MSQRQSEENRPADATFIYYDDKCPDGKGALLSGIYYPKTKEVRSSASNFNEAP